MTYEYVGGVQGRIDSGFVKTGDGDNGNYDDDDGGKMRYQFHSIQKPKKCFRINVKSKFNLRMFTVSSWEQQLNSGVRL